MKSQNLIGQMAYGAIGGIVGTTALFGLLTAQKKIPAQSENAGARRPRRVYGRSGGRKNFVRERAATSAKTSGKSGGKLAPFRLRREWRRALCRASPEG